MAKNTIKTIQERIAELREKYPEELEPMARWWSAPGRRALQFLGEKLSEKQKQPTNHPPHTPIPLR